MSQDIDSNERGNGGADAFAATALITLFVVTMSIWLSGMPS